MAAAALIAVGAANAAEAPPPSPSVRVELRRQPVSEGLARLRSLGVNVAFAPDQVRGRTGSALTGAYSPDAALKALLAGTGLSYEAVPAGGFVVFDPARRAVGTSPRPTEDEAAAVSEVVVTATKREQRLQDAALAVSAVTGADLLARRDDRFEDFARSVPGLGFVQASPVGTKVVIRGVSTGSSTEPRTSVGFYIDEIPISSAYAATGADLRPVDLDRVEVLRGPQGTLYGATSLSGTVREITAKPDLRRFGGSVDITGSGTEGGGANSALDLVFNAPLAQDKAGLRLVAYDRYTAGYVDNVDPVYGHDDVNYQRISGGRMSLLLKPTDRLTMTATAILQRGVYGGNNSYDADPTGAPLYGVNRQDRATPERYVSDYRIGNLTAAYDLDWAKFVTSTSYFVDDRAEDTDFTSSFAPFLGGREPSFYRAKERTVVEEARLSSPDAQRFRWLVGVYYQDGTAPFRQSIYATEDSFVGPQTLFDDVIRSTLTEYAAFGEAYFDITPKLTLTGGLRYSYLKSTYDQAENGLITAGVPAGSAKSHEDRVDPKVELAYKITPDVLGYVLAASGFRAGGPNLALPPDPVTGISPPPTFKSDSIWNYEVGLKTAFLQRRVTANLAAFYIDWSDIQTSVTRSDNFVYFANGRGARSLGVEFEGTAVLAPGLTGRLAGAYTDAQLTQDAPLLSPNALKGTRIPATPEVTGSASLEYRRPIGAFVGVARADWSYTGRSRNDFDTPALLKSYQLANLSLGIEKGPYALTAFVDNIGDEHGRLSAEFRSATVSYVTITQPRTAGVRLRAAF